MIAVNHTGIFMTQLCSVGVRNVRYKEWKRCGRRKTIFWTVFSLDWFQTPDVTNSRLEFGSINFGLDNGAIAPSRYLHDLAALALCSSNGSTWILGCPSFTSSQNRADYPSRRSPNAFTKSWHSHHGRSIFCASGSSYGSILVRIGDPNRRFYLCSCCINCNPSVCRNWLVR